LRAETLHTRGDVEQLLAHVLGGGRPASAILLDPPAPVDVALLVDRGWRPDNGANEMVDVLTIPDPEGRDEGPDDLTVDEVTDHRGLLEVVKVLTACGWYDVPGEDPRSDRVLFAGIGGIMCRLAAAQRSARPLYPRSWCGCSRTD
jgi:hypothetical protein